MMFLTNVAGIPCKCNVTTFWAATPMRVYGSGFADAVAPIDEVFEFQLLDRKGYPARWLEKKLTDEDEERLREEYQLLELAEYYDPI